MIFFFINKIVGEKKRVNTKIFSENKPIKDNICRVSSDHEKLYAQRFQGNSGNTAPFKKSAREKNKLIKKTDAISFFIKLPTNKTGKEKVRDRIRGIKIKAKGIKIWNAGSNVSE